MIRIIYLFSILFLTSAFGYREPNYSKMMDHIIKNYLKEIAEPRGLIFKGSGGAMMGDIQSITLDFFSCDTLKVDKARVLYVELMEEFLRRINCHKMIRPYLHDLPFKEENIELSIRFINAEGRTMRDGHVALMSIAKDHRLYFAAYDPNTKIFYDLCEEPYPVDAK